MTIKVQKEDILSRTSLFREISRENLVSLAEICLAKHLKKHDVLFHEGDKGHSVYILVTGSVKLIKSGPGGKEVVIKLVKAGEMFAEAVLFEKSTYPVSAVSLQTGMAYMIPTIQFDCLLVNECFRRDFLGVMMKKLRYLTSQISYLSAYDVDDRLFIFLEEQYGAQENIITQISKKEIAAAIRTTPETLSRVVLHLKELGKLKWEGNKISIPAKVWEEFRRRKN